MGTILGIGLRYWPDGLFCPTKILFYMQYQLYFWGIRTTETLLKSEKILILQYRLHGI